MEDDTSIVDLLNADWTKVAVTDTNLVTQMMAPPPMRPGACR